MDGIFIIDIKDVIGFGVLVLLVVVCLGMAFINWAGDKLKRKKKC